MVKKITPIVKAIQQKNNSLEYESPQIKTTPTTNEVGRSFEPTQTRVPKVVGYDLRRAILICGLSTTRKHSLTKTSIELPRVNSPHAKRSTITILPMALETGQASDPVKAN